MDRQERHELEQNDLAEFIENFGEWWSKWGNYALIGVMVLLLAFAGWRFYRSSTNNARQSAWESLAYETSPQGYREAAQAAQDPTVQALAYLQAGDLLLGQALNPADAQAATDADAAPDESPAPVPVVDAEQSLETARAMYEQALEVAPGPIYQLNALLGLGAVAESQQDWDAARQTYEQAIELAGDRYTGIAAQAEARLAMLDELKTPVVFAPDPPAPPTSTESDAGQDAAPSATGDATSPASTLEPAADAPAPEPAPASQE